MRTLTMISGLLLCALCRAQMVENAIPTTGPAAPEDRLLLPHNFVRGYFDIQFAAPHNEPDLGFCDYKVGTPPGAPPCAAYARYVWSGYMEVQPFGRTPLKRLFLIWEPKLFGGNNVPQLSYTASPALIMTEQNIGAGISLPRGFELRLNHHWGRALGRYAATPSSATYRTDGPYGLNTTVGVRWYFGGYGAASPR